MKRVKYILLALVCLWPLTAYSVSPNKNGTISLEQAVSIAKSRTGGRVLSADQRKVEGKPMYRIKILTPSGRVRNIYIDPVKER